MVNVNKLGILLQKTSLGFENEGVLNPAVISAEGAIHMFYRAITKDNYSTIGYCRLSSPMHVESRNTVPMLFPQDDYEFQGLEDPRIVYIEGVYYLTYTAYDGENALGALATSKDLKNWQKVGIIVPKLTYREFKHFIESESEVKQKYTRFNEYRKNHSKQEGKELLWDKNLVFFPRKIDGKFYFLHRIKPDIQLVGGVEKLEDLNVEYWQNYFLHFQNNIVLAPKHQHEISYIGGGCPPIETEAGWLIIYHGVHDTAEGYVYSACVALLQLDNPQVEIARLPYPLFFPTEDWELKGEVNNVCFPSGAIVEDDTLFVYYGAADERIAVASLSLKELLNELQLYAF